MLWQSLSSELQEAIAACLTATVEERPSASELLGSAAVMRLVNQLDSAFLKAENDALKAVIVGLKAENAHLKERLLSADNECRHEKDQLRAEIAALEAKNATLKTEVAKVSQLENSLKDLRSELARMQIIQQSLPSPPIPVPQSTPPLVVKQFKRPSQV